MVLRALAAEGVQAMVATAGRVPLVDLQTGAGDVHVAEYLPGIQAAARADLVI